MKTYTLQAGVRPSSLWGRSVKHDLKPGERRMERQSFTKNEGLLVVTLHRREDGRYEYEHVHP